MARPVNPFKVGDHVALKRASANLGSLSDLPRGAVVPVVEVDGSHVYVKTPKKARDCWHYSHFKSAKPAEPAAPKHTYPERIFASAVEQEPDDKTGTLHLCLEGTEVDHVRLLDSQSDLIAEYRLVRVGKLKKQLILEEEV